MPQADSDKPIYLALHKLILYLYVVVKHFPKELKYTLGGDMLALAWKTFDLVIFANGVANSEKKIYIQKALSCFNSLKYRFRVGAEKKVISYHRYSHIIKQSIEIEKMLVGWLSWSKKF